MPLDDQYPKCVAFVTTERQLDDGSSTLAPIGTAFFVGVPVGLGTDRSFSYAVTAGHVVARDQPYYLRLNTAEGVTDLPVHEWHRHPTEDVAVTAVTMGADTLHKKIPTDMFASEGINPFPQLGDRVYFIGLLSFLQATQNEITPMVRSGTIGRLNQANVPIEWDNTLAQITCHLIDCRSYGGFSGAPCFIQAQVSEYRESQIPGGAIGNVLFDKVALLGLISGHFDQTEKARVRGDDSIEVHTRINSGVGLVTPARFIREALEMEELENKRQAALIAAGLINPDEYASPGDSCLAALPDA